MFLGAAIQHPLVLSLTDCVVRNLSPGGARIALSAAVPVPDRFALVVKGRETIGTVEVVWRRGDALGVRFLPQTERDGGAESESAADRAGVTLH